MQRKQYLWDSGWGSEQDDPGSAQEQESLLHELGLTQREAAQYLAGAR